MCVPNGFNFGVLVTARVFLRIISVYISAPIDCYKHTLASLKNFRTPLTKALKENTIHHCSCKTIGLKRGCRNKQTDFDD